MIIVDTNVVAEAMRASPTPAVVAWLNAQSSASHYGEVMGRRQELGRPLSVPDGQIAALARLHRFAVATRNLRDLLDCGIELLDPFTPPAPG